MILERREFVEAGGAITEEFHPGFRASTLAHTIGPLRFPDIASDYMQARKIRVPTWRIPTPRLFAPTPDGKALLFYNDHAKTAGGIARFASAKDAAKYTEFAGHPRAPRSHPQSGFLLHHAYSTPSIRPLPKILLEIFSRPDAAFAASARKACSISSVGAPWPLPISYPNFSTRNSCAP